MCTARQSRSSVIFNVLEQWRVESKRLLWQATMNWRTRMDEVESDGRQQGLYDFIFSTRCLQSRWFPSCVQMMRLAGWHELQWMVKATCISLVDYTKYCCNREFVLPLDTVPSLNWNHEPYSKYSVALVSFTLYNVIPTSTYCFIDDLQCGSSHLSKLIMTWRTDGTSTDIRTRLQHQWEHFLCIPKIPGGYALEEDRSIDLVTTLGSSNPISHNK